MTNDKFGIVWDDENSLVTEFFDTEEEAIKFYEGVSDQTWDELQQSHSVQEFTPQEMKESENWPDV